MSKLKVVFLSAESDCEDCGSSYSEGAKVYLDDTLILELIPVASCFGGAHWDSTEVYKKILTHLGYEAEEVYGEAA